jgi:hypothetical protein
VTEPAVYLNNLSPDVTMQDLEAAAEQLQVVAIDYEEGSGAAVLTVSSPAEARLAAQHFSNMDWEDEGDEEDGVASAVEHELHDLGLVVSATGDPSKLTPAALAEVLQRNEMEPKSVTFQTHVRAEIGFMNIKEVRKSQPILAVQTDPNNFLNVQAQDALNYYVKGGVKLPANSNGEKAAVTATLNTLPTYVLQVEGLDAETPLQKLTDALAKAVPEARVIRADRTALVKFKRHHDVSIPRRSPSA